MSKTDEKNRAMRRDQIVRSIRALRQRGDSPASKLAESKVSAVADSLVRTLADDSELENAIASLVEQFPSVTMAAENSPEDRAAKEAAKIAAGPTLDEIKAMPNAAARLEAINALEARQREEAARESAKLDSEHSPDELKSMSPARRLEIANELARFGADKPEPKTLSPEQVRRLDAARRLDHVNQQIEASRKNSAALAKRLKAAKENAE
ncbi:MAG TPA: hypothetical protein VGH02_11705 [Rhizomicrobium sp.]|jgi:hypothetical protein